MRYIFVFLPLMFLFQNMEAQDEFFEPQTNIGGYGELHFNRKLSGDSPPVLDFHRFILFVSHSFTENWSFKSEVELEHNLVDEGKGELELEQAYIDYNYKRWLGFQAGVILIPAGIVNEYHEPPMFFGVERPEYNTYLIPTTWYGNGLALYGKFAGFDYKFSITEGLNSDNFSFEYGIRKGRYKGFKADAGNLLYNLRMNYTGTNNLLLGASVSYNNDKGDSTNIQFKLFEAHFRYSIENFYITAEFGIAQFNWERLNKFTGFYMDLGYDLKNILKTGWNVMPFFRFSGFVRSSSAVSGSNVKETIRRFGLSVKPVSEIVLKTDYAFKRNLNDVIEKQFNIGIGYMF